MCGLDDWDDTGAENLLLAMLVISSKDVSGAMGVLQDTETHRYGDTALLSLLHVQTP
jgi:hypothetical protein